MESRNNLKNFHKNIAAFQKSCDHGESPATVHVFHHLTTNAVIHTCDS